MVTVEIAFVADYACCGIVDDEVGFIHCTDWSWHRPAPESDCPKIGDKLQAKVLRVFDESQKVQLPENATFYGRFKSIDFVGSIRQAFPDRNPWRDAAVFRVGNVFRGRIYEVDSVCADLSHPLGVQCELALRDSEYGNLHVGDEVLVRIQGIKDQVLIVTLVNPSATISEDRS